MRTILNIFKIYMCYMQICEDDIECHSYEEIATAPAMRIADTVAADPLVHAVGE